MFEFLKHLINKISVEDALCLSDQTDKLESTLQLFLIGPGVLFKAYWE